MQTYNEGTYDQALLTGADLTITCTMKVSEDATGTLNNKAVLTGTRDEASYEVSVDTSVTIAIDSIAPVYNAKADTSADDEATPDETPKTGDSMLPWWLLMVMEKVGL